MSNLKYNREFFEQIRLRSSESAKVIVPLVIKMFSPSSIVDVGCGTGSWLAEFAARGISDYLGIDGNSTTVLDLPPHRFKQCDLTQPIILNRKFDLAMCLEVAEHLPPSRADGLIKDLVQLAPVVLFSAAVPGQGGTHHINEQWPDYWFQKFANWDYGVHDHLRFEVWNDKRIEWWYRQNIAVYINREHAKKCKLQAKTAAPLCLVHPECFSKPHGPIQVLKSDIPGWFALQLGRVRRRLLC